MAKYSTFLAISTAGKPLLVTSSARKAQRMLRPGVRVEVWTENEKALTVYHKTRQLLTAYIEAERGYIRAKQQAAEERNRRRRK